MGRGRGSNWISGLVRIALPAIALSATGCYQSHSRIGDSDASMDTGVDTPPADTWDAPFDTIVDPLLDDASDTPVVDTTDAPDAVPPVCGNGILEEGEECDDGDVDECNGCTAGCRFERALETVGWWQVGAIVGDVMPCLPSYFTVEAWIDHDGTPNFTYLILEEDYIYLGISTPYPRAYSPCSIFQENGWGFSGGGDLSDHSDAGWHHFAATAGPSSPGIWSLSLFWDGQPAERAASLDYMLVPACVGPMEILSWYGARIDDLRISDGVLYTTEFDPPRRLEPSPDTIAMWSFDDAVDGVVPDLSGHGHDAVLVDGRLVPDACHLP